MRIAVVLLLVTSVFAKDKAYAPRIGAFPVKSARVELPRGEKKKPLRVRISFPAPGKEAPHRERPWPVIVFSHGMFGSGDAYDPLVRAWAQSGYVVLQPTHPDSVKLGTRSRGEAVKAWSSRPVEIRLILDSLQKIERMAKELRGKLDPERIGMGGHSFGCHTSMLVTGVKPRLRRGGPFFDKRIRCAYLVSPQGKSPLFTEDSWRQWRVPAVIVTGDKDTDPFGDKNKGPLWRLDPYRFSPPQDKYMLWIDGAYHGFGGISGAWKGGGPKNEKHVALVRDTGLAFFDAYLKQTRGAKAWLHANTKPKTKPGAKPKEPSAPSGPSKK